MQQTSQPAAVDAKWHPQERYAFLYLPLLALLVTIVVELFNHKSFTEGLTGFWNFLSQDPLAMLVNVLIVLVTLVPAFFLRRRVFWCALVAFLWLVCGGVNGFILLNRMTPFTVADLTVDVQARTVTRAGRSIDLTAREFSLLEYMVRNRGIVLSRERIENSLWNYDYTGGTNVVDVYVGYLRRKMDTGFDKKLIHTVWGTGWVLKEE